MNPGCKVCCSVSALLIGLISVAIGFLTLFFFDPMVQKVIYSQIIISEGSAMMNNFANPPVTPMLKVYFFNVSNPLEFLAGDKPVLKEVGPYVWSQKWERVNIQLHNNGTVSSALKKRYYFERSLSYGADSDNVTILDVPTVTAVWQVRNTPRFIQLIFSSMLEVLDKGPFATRNVSDFVWGYEDDLIKMAKDIMPPESRPPNDYFGFFYGVNNSDTNTLTQFTGSVDDMSQYMEIENWNGRSKMDWWKTDECNKIRGSDGSGWSPGLNRTSTIHLFNGAMCRALPLVYQRDVEKYGIKGYRFAPAKNVFDPPSRNPDNACYCVDGPPCIGGGVFNISSCKFGSPTVLSWPHFYNADPQYQDAIGGLNPDPEKHEFYVEVIPSTGLPLQANGRMQVNMMLTNVSEIKPTKGLRPMLFPVLWFQDGVPEMPEETQNQLRMSVNLPETMKITVLSVSFILGVALLVSGLVTCIKSCCCDSDDEIAKAKKQRNNLEGRDNNGMEKD